MSGYEYTGSEKLYAVRHIKSKVVYLDCVSADPDLTISRFLSGRYKADYGWSRPHDWCFHQLFGDGCHIDYRHEVVELEVTVGTGLSKNDDINGKTYHENFIPK